MMHSFRTTSRDVPYELPNFVADGEIRAHIPPAILRPDGCEAADRQQNYGRTQPCVTAAHSGLEFFNLEYRDCATLTP
jgi:hypothetical protein